MLPMKKPLYLLAAVLLILIACGCNKNTDADYPIRPVSFTSVKLTDDFWAPRIKKNASVTIPIAFSYCESSGRIKNFEIAGGLDTGTFRTIYPFDDSDVFKIIEGASYSLQTNPDRELDAYLDSLIWKIGLAQEEDGYLYTNRTISEMHGGKGLHEWASPERWLLDSILSHELYNIGHLYEAAVAIFRQRAKDPLLILQSGQPIWFPTISGMTGLKSIPGIRSLRWGWLNSTGLQVTGSISILQNSFST